MFFANFSGNAIEVHLMTLKVIVFKYFLVGRGSVTSGEIFTVFSKGNRAPLGDRGFLRFPVRGTQLCDPPGHRMGSLRLGA